MATARVIVGCDWTFSNPEEVNRRFQRDSPQDCACVKYDAVNHCFIIECSLSNAESATQSLQKIMQEYLSEEGMKNLIEVDLNSSSIHRLAESFKGSGYYSNVWDTVNQLDNNACESSFDQTVQPESLKSLPIPHSTMNNIRNELEEIVHEVQSATGCDISIDTQSDSFIITGKTEGSVETASGLLYQAAERRSDTAKIMCYDFLSETCHDDVHLRLVRSPIIESRMSSSARPPTCQLIAVEWISSSRQWKSRRKDASPITKTSGDSLWTSPLTFMHTREQNRPQNDANLMTDQDSYRHLSVKQLARTSYWNDQVTGSILLRNSRESSNRFRSESIENGSEFEIGGVPETSKVPDLIETENPSIGDAVLSAKTTNTDHPLDPIASAGDVRAERMPEYIDFEKLQAPRMSGRLQTKTSNQFITDAYVHIMRNTATQGKSSFVSECILGRIDIYTLTVPSPDHRPYAKSPVVTFSAKDWSSLFKTMPHTEGASTTFNPRLTKKWEDIDFLLGLRLNKGDFIFLNKAKHRTAWFEICCRDPETGLSAMVEIHENGRARIEGMPVVRGRINVHHPFNKWDLCWQLSCRDQNFTADQESLFRSLIENVYVAHRDDGEDPDLYSRVRADIVSVRLVHETVHRTCSENLKLCLRQYKDVEVRRTADGGMWALPESKRGLFGVRGTWWEAKLISPTLQKTLGTYQSTDSDKAAFDPTYGQYHFLLMLELASEAVRRIDGIGSE